MGRGPQVTNCRPLARGAMCPRDRQSALDGAAGGWEEVTQLSSFLPVVLARALLMKRAAGSGQSQQRCSVTGRTGQEPAGQPPRKGPGAYSSTNGLGGRGGHRPGGGGWRTHTQIHTHTPIHTRTNTHTHRYTHIHTQIYTHTHG